MVLVGRIREPDAKVARSAKLYRREMHGSTAEALEVIQRAQDAASSNIPVSPNSPSDNPLPSETEPKPPVVTWQRVPLVNPNMSLSKIPARESGWYLPPEDPTQKGKSKRSGASDKDKKSSSHGANMRSSSPGTDKEFSGNGKARKDFGTEREGKGDEGLHHKSKTTAGSRDRDKSIESHGRSRDAGEYLPKPERKISRSRDSKQHALGERKSRDQKE